MGESVFLSQLVKERVWPRYELSLKRERTRRDYYRYVSRICDYLCCDFLCIDAVMAQGYFYHMESRADGYTPKSLHSMLSALRSFATYIEKNRSIWGLDDYVNPFVGVLVSSYTDNLHMNDIPLPDQVDAILSAASVDTQMYLILLLVLRCGLSVSEVCRLKASCVRQDEAGRFFLEIIKNDGKMRRNVKIPTDILPAVLSFCGECPSDGPLFYNQKGQPLQVRTLQMYFSDLVKSADLGRSFTLQDIRHASIAYMRKGGAEASSVASYTGISERWVYRYNGVLDELTAAPCDYGIIQVRGA